ncbi:MAG: CFI-box-CTERM domain-containing protein [Candidatus Bruticola sp.]
MEDKQEAEVFDSYCVEKIWPEEKAKQVFQIEKAFLKSYAASQEVPLAQWLAQELHKQLPEKSANEVEAISSEIISALQTAEEMKASQQKAIAIGRSKESWFASKVMQATADMPISKRAEYLQSLEEAIKSANEATYKVIAAENGSSNSASASTAEAKTEAAEKRQESNSALNIGKQACHAGVQTAAATAGRDLAQKVLNGEEIDGDEVVKKAVDAGVGEAVKVAVDGATKVAEEKGWISHEAKAEATEKRQQESGRQSNSGSSEAKPKIKENEYSLKVTALSIGRQACYAGVQNAAVAVGRDLAQKVLNGEEIDGDEVVKKAVDAGVDEGVKVAVAGAIKVAGEKGLIPQIQQLKGGSGNVCANVAFVAIENVKVAKQVADGRLTVHEGLEVMAQTTGACAAGMAVAAKGGAIVGSALGSVVGPWGTAIGGFVGNTLGYVAGSTIGGVVMQGAKALYDGARNVVKNVASAAVNCIGSVVNTVASGIKSVGNAIFGGGGGGGGCYITTATCQEYGKGDNCYELTMFRSFRDMWLRKQPDGEQLIKRYYATAPALVELINQQPNRRAIYRHLNEAYLSKCLRYIEDGENIKCKELYVDMVEFLYGEQQRWQK